MKKLIWTAAAATGAVLVLAAQDVDFRAIISGGSRPAIAIPNLRGDGPAAPLMPAFNQTLQSDIASSGWLKIVPQTSFPATIPQQPSDFKEPPPVVQAPRSRRGRIVTPPNGGGLWLSDWSGPPTNANYLAFGYTFAQNGLFVLKGWLFDLSRGTPANAQVFGNSYIESLDEAGARKAAHEFAADILAKFGGKSLFGTHIYFVSNRTGHDEIWVMDPDGSNQRQITKFNSLTLHPAISPDGTKLAFTSYARGNPAIFMFSVDPVRNLGFYNQRGASVTETPSFTPDGKQIVYSSSAGDACCRIYIANLDGSGFRPLTSGHFIDVEPKVNPKTGGEIAFVSGRSGPQQIYRMNMDGADIERLTDGTGEASNPSWNPNGQFLAFSWTRGFAAGKWNVFIMDVATRKYTQLTHDEGRNENPGWAPDGVHLAFGSTRNGRSQIWTMLADGTQLHCLTTQGSNRSPAWGK
jgi:TolB protein